MATNYVPVELIGRGCTGDSGTSGSGSGGQSSGLGEYVLSPDEGIVDPTGIPDCGAGIYWQIWQTMDPIVCQASDGDIAVLPIPWPEIGDNDIKADWLLDLKIQAICDESGDAGYELNQVIPIDGGRFNGIREVTNSDAFSWYLDNDVVRDWLYVMFNYQGGAAEALQKVLLNPSTAKFEDMDIEKWKIRVVLLTVLAAV